MTTNKLPQMFGSKTLEKKPTDNSGKRQESSPEECTSMVPVRAQVPLENDQGQSDDAKYAQNGTKETELSHEVGENRKNDMHDDATSNEDSAIRVAELEEEIRRLQGQIKSYAENYQLLQQQLRAVQEGAFRALKKGTWIPKEDHRVRGEFVKLEENTRIWAKTYAFSDISALEAKITDTEKSRVLSKLVGYYYGDWDGLVSCTKSLVQKRLPRILVQALLVKDIFEKIFDNPFLCLNEETEHEEQFRSPFGTQLIALYSEMEKGSHS